MKNKIREHLKEIELSKVRIKMRKLTAYPDNILIPTKIFNKTSSRELFVTSFLGRSGGAYYG
ncbi:hypothetical protein B6U96_17515 [Archaeoglobales archaeon ex4484_92]|nr:MAG: hypothetical protein B6U96_17515 [Archaeoglobales archaeon ex4484_92]